MKKHKERLRPVTFALFVIYLLILVWIILFKLEFSLSDINHIRNVNLIPFHYSDLAGERVHIKEVAQNVLTFLPLGVFLSMLAPRLKLWTKIAVILGISFALEISQYIWAVGRTDITDLITNTTGGALGVGAYGMILAIFKNKQKIDMVITIAAAVVTVALLGLFAVLFIFNKDT